MDTSEIEERLNKLEANSCYKVRFYSASSPRPTVGVKKVLYINQDTNDIFIWDGSSYQAILTSYKKYVALLTQSGANPPVPIVLEDTIGISESDYSRVAVGDYRITKTDAFPVGKTIFFSRQFRDVDQGLAETGVYLNHNSTSPSSILRLSVGEGGAGEENVLDTMFYGFIEIRVYP